jgi:hypothetical protein
VELLDPPDFETPRRYGMTCAVASFVKSNTIRRGFNRVEHHDSILKELEERLPLVKAAGIPNQIVFSGNRDGLGDREGCEREPGEQAEEAGGGEGGGVHDACNLYVGRPWRFDGRPRRRRLASPFPVALRHRGLWTDR